MKHVEKQSDFVWEIDCTTSSNEHVIATKYFDFQAYFPRKSNLILQNLLIESPLISFISLIAINAANCTSVKREGNYIQIHREFKKMLDTIVAIHFNMADHSLEEISILVIDLLFKSNNYRKHKNNILVQPAQYYAICWT